MEPPARRKLPGVTPETMQGYLRVRPFRPFVLKTYSGRVFKILHPDVIETKGKEMVILRHHEPATEIPPGAYEKVLMYGVDSITYLT